MVPLTGPVLPFKRCSGVRLRFALWYMLLKLNKKSNVFLHKHLRHLAVALNTGLSPDSNGSSICMRYSRGSHANQFHYQCSNLLCVTVQTEQLLSAWNAERYGRKARLLSNTKSYIPQLYVCTVFRSLCCVAGSVTF